MKIHPSLQAFFKTIFQGSHKRSTSLRAYKNIYPIIICKCVNPFAYFIYLRSSVGRYSDKASLIYMTQINILSTSTITMLPCLDVGRSCPHLPHESNQIRYDLELFHLAINASHWNLLRIMATGDSNGFGATLCLATAYGHMNCHAPIM